MTANHFRCLSEAFISDLLELVKEKGVYPYEYMDSFETFSEDKLPDRFHFLVLEKISICIIFTCY